MTSSKKSKPNLGPSDIKKQITGEKNEHVFLGFDHLHYSEDMPNQRTAIKTDAESQPR